MLLTQKYHSALDIDQEFIPSLEELLCECIPSFEWIKNFEANSPEETHFAYYLFFGKHHNSPVGFAQVSLESESKNKKSLMSRFIKPKDIPVRSKNAHWKMPGSLNEGIIFEPMYVKDAAKKTKDIFHEYLEREDIAVQSLCFSEAFSELKNVESNVKVLSNEKIIPSTLVKNQSNYEMYLNSLSNHLEKEIKYMWRDFYKDEMKLGEYNSLKDIFSYRKGSADIYKSLKSNPLFRKYKDEACTYLTVERENEVLAIVFYIKGHGHHYFFDKLILNPKCDELILTQLVIMKFYENQDSNRLHLLGTTGPLGLYQNQGFTTRSQIYLSVDQK
jgi:hypothetical protein